MLSVALVVVIIVALLVLAYRGATGHRNETGVIAAAPQSFPTDPEPMKSAPREAPQVEHLSTGPAPVQTEVQLRERQFGALLEQMKSVCAFNHQGQRGDFSSMRLVIAHREVGGAAGDETGYLLKREPDGRFSTKEEYQRLGGQYLPAAEAVELLWKRFGPITDPKFQAEQDDEVREATSWLPVEPHLQAFLDPTYRSCVAFIRTRPGIFPGMARYKYARKLYHQDRPWVPPDLAVVDPDNLATVDNPDHADGRCRGCGYEGPHPSKQEGRHVRFCCGLGCSATWLGAIGS